VVPLLLCDINSKYVARLNIDDTFDTSFLLELNSLLNALAIQQDGIILIEGKPF
jgi:hypothetical protein